MTGHDFYCNLLDFKNILAMATNIILKKEQLVKTSNGGSIHECKILGYPKEPTPLKPYSSVFYWSHMTSDFGSVLTEHPIIGFEILTYVIKGTYDSYDKIHDKWTKLNQGDMQIIQAGKGIRYSGKLFPLSEILLIWLDPDFNVYRKIDPVLSEYTSDIITVKALTDNEQETIHPKRTSIKLNSKNVSVQVIEFLAGFHDIPCPRDAVLSGYILDGYVELSNTLLGTYDYFKFEGKSNLPLASLTNSKLFLIVSPLKPEYQTYAEIYNTV